MTWLSRKIERIADERLHRFTSSKKLVEHHYQALFERAQAEADRNKEWLFEAWRTMAGQTRGLQRQARKIKRLRAENAELRRKLEEKGSG